MSEENLSYFEKRLTHEVEEIEKRIKSLHDEKAVLLRQLAKARADRTGIQSVTRKNSLYRVLAENSVVEYLKKNGRTSTSQLYQNARLTNFDLKEATFRTYLHRMKRKDMVKTSRNVGYWELVSPPAP